MNDHTARLPSSLANRWVQPMSRPHGRQEGGQREGKEVVRKLHLTYGKESPLTTANKAKNSSMGL